MMLVTSLLLCYILQLPLPYLKVGYHLTAPPADDPIASHKLWDRSQFILNHEELQQVFVFTTQPTCVSHLTARIILSDTDPVITNLGQHL